MSKGVSFNNDCLMTPNAIEFLSKKDLDWKALGKTIALEVEGVKKIHFVVLNLEEALEKLKKHLMFYLLSLANPLKLVTLLL